jgi:predicted NBD/HSP70 family sugar kinase
MKRRSGINMSDVKISNRAMILNQVKGSPKSRKDIAEKLKLTPAAITMLVNELIEQGCVRESGHVDEPVRVGRKKVFIELNKDYRYVIGVNIEGKHVNIGLGNLQYEVMASRTESISGLSSEQIMKLIIKQIGGLLQENQIEIEKCLGIGVGVVGKVDTKNGVSKHAYGIWDREVDIAGILEEALSLPVIVENNVRALALAEMELTQHKKISNLVFMKLGPGIGSAVILDKEIYKGAHNDSGEIGHMMIDLEGKTCQCGLVGCLETVASITSLFEDIKADYHNEVYPIIEEITGGDLQRLNESHIIEAYVKGEEAVIKKVDQMLVYLSIGIINSIKFYDPHKLVLYSEMFNEPILYKKLIDEIAKHQIENSLEDMIETSNLIAPKSVGGVVLCAKKLFYNKGAMVPEMTLNS